MKKHYKRFVPARHKLEKHRALRPIAHLLGDPRIWHFNRHTIPMGIAIGIFFGSLPIFGQMLLSAVVAISVRVNMPIAMFSTLISNPLTMPFFFTGNYYFGTWLMGKAPTKLGEIDWSLHALIELGGHVLVPLFFGSIVVGVILSTLSYFIFHVWWRFNVMWLHRKRLKRYAKKMDKAKPPS